MAAVGRTFWASSSRAASCSARHASTGCASTSWKISYARPAAALLEGAKDPAARQRGEHRAPPRHRDVAELGEVRGVVRDLRPRRRHEVVEEPGCDVLLRPACSRAIAPSRCSSTMCCAPPRRSSVAARSIARARGALLLPDALHHELEVRRLDPRRPPRRLRPRRARRAQARSGRRPPRRGPRSTSSGSTAMRLARESA